jgi:DNA-binding FadR family transcriptional regulator
MSPLAGNLEQDFVVPDSSPDNGVGDPTTDLVWEIQQVVQDLPVGSSLPSEASLAERFGVSRLTVREALKVLSGRGFTASKQGRRAVVTEPSSEVISSIFASYVHRDPSALLELVEVRQALEVRSVSLAASKATRAGLGAMAASLRFMKDAAQTLNDAAASDEERNQARLVFQRSDVAFHESVALASGNRMLAHVLEALEDSLLRAFDASFDGHVLRGGSALDAYGAHLKIFEFIEARDVRGASGAMKKHLQQSEKDLRAYLNGTTSSPVSARATVD